MKKIAVLLAMVLAMVFSVGALAEDIDLSSMTNEELTALLCGVMDELQVRTDGVNSNDRIGRGSYVVGTDIKAGTYDFICLDSETYDDGSPDNDVLVYDESGSYVSRSYSMEIGAHAIVSITDGQILKIEGCSGILTPSKPSWVP